MMAFQEMTPETITSFKFEEQKKRISWAVNINQLMQISIQKNPRSLGLSWEGFEDNLGTNLKYFMWLLL